jgi:siderophore synthetase component
LKGTTVSLTIPAGEIINRFTLRFSNATLSSEDNSINKTYVFFNTNEKVVEIANNKNLEIEEATLFSILGQKINHWEINSNENSIKLPVKNIETGVYIVKIKTNNNTYFTEKIIIK